MLHRWKAVTTLALGLVFLLNSVAFAKPEPPEDEALKQVLVAAFDAAVKKDFKAYLKTIHEEDRDTHTQKQHIERFSWKRFTKQVSWYLIKDDPTSFEIVRRDSSSPDRKRVFIKDQQHESRMPVPVRFKKQKDGKWGIVANSL